MACLQGQGVLFACARHQGRGERSATRWSSNELCVVFEYSIPPPWNKEKYSNTQPLLRRSDICTLKHPIACVACNAGGRTGANPPSPAPHTSQPPTSCPFSFFMTCIDKFPTVLTLPLCFSSYVPPARLPCLMSSSRRHPPPAHPQAARAVIAEPEKSRRGAQERVHDQAHQQISEVLQTNVWNPSLAHACVYVRVSMCLRTCACVFACLVACVCACVRFDCRAI